ncbi:MAG: hypothetical protein JNK30_12305 [Phenylobacterium sp.]|uniref:hypothetical protein n=1 Tax=Phenylobacterium sp. TaxID=1871053 RepID=UPI001A56AB07|nr:hypothetical protein [Phenylobacterium sp.]MBL8772156.1 hypothetical protein [Phenylobacterium sp.]
MAQFSPSDAALEGFRLTKEHPGVMLAWSAVYFGGILLIALAMMATLGPQFIALARKGELLNANPQEVAGLLASSWPAFLLVMVMTALLMSIIAAGVMRLVLRPTEHGFAHLRLGKDELRLTVANLICIVIYALWGIVGIVFTAGASQSGAVGGFVAALIAFIVAMWIGVRLSLLLPTVFVTGRISLGLAWEKTKGRFWSLLGMIVLAVIFYVIVYILFSVISFAIVELSGGQAAMQDLGSLTPVAAIATMLTLVMQLLLQVLQIVMIYGPFATAYRAIEADAAEAS